MFFLFVVNLAIAFVLLFLPFFVSKYILRIGWYSPLTIVCLVYFPVEFLKLFSGFMDFDFIFTVGYQFAVFMDTLQKLLFLFLCWLAVRLKFVDRLVVDCFPVGVLLSFREIRFLSIIFLIISFIVFYYMAYSTGGLYAWITDVRGSYIEKRSGFGLFYALSLSYLFMSYILISFNQSSIRKLFLITLIYLFLTYFYGSKGYLLTIFCAFLVFSYRLDRVKSVWILVRFLPFTMVGLAYQSFSGSVDQILTAVAEYFSYFRNAAIYYEDFFSGLHGYYYGEVWLTSFWQFVPRFIYPDKPFIYGILHVVEVYFPGGPASGNTPPFYAGVEQFSDFGVLGVIVSSILSLAPFIYLAMAKYLLVQRNFFAEGRRSLRDVIFAGVLFLPAFGVFFNGAAFVLLLFTIYVVAVGAISLRRRLTVI